MGLGIMQHIRQNKKYKRTIKNLNKTTEVYKNKKLILTKDQIKEAKEYWKPYLRLKKRDILCLDWYTRMNDEFSPSYIPAHIFYRKVLPQINDVKFAEAIQQKGYLDFIFPGVKRPYTVIARISGIYYSNGMILCGKELPLKELKEDVNYIYKPQKDSCSGHNIFIFKKSEINLHKESFDASDYLIQEIIKPCKELSDISLKLTTFRIYTLFYNGEVEVLNFIYRIGGSKNNAVDNWSSGGVPVVVLENGKAFEYGVMKDLKTRATFIISDNKKIFIKDLKLPDLSPLIETAIRLAKSFPQIAYIGWDMTFDENHNPVLIEANMSHSDVFFLHMHPRYKEILGKYTREILSKTFHNSHY